MDDGKAERYRRYAEECQKEAAHARNRSNGRSWLKLAEVSRKMATKSWPAPGSEDTKFGVKLEPEVCHGETEVYARVQA
jgi:hypothetical protein